MKSKEDIEKLEKVIMQLGSAHEEISIIAKKSPNDALNKFKLRLINKILSDANEVFGKEYMPFEGFNQFEEDEMPTNSDVTMVLSQYLSQMERFRSDNIVYSEYDWRYILNGKATHFTAAEPTKVGENK